MSNEWTPDNILAVNDVLALVEREGDFSAWRDPDTSLRCILARNLFGAWCGYVEVPTGHPWHGLDHGDDALDDIDVHGGVTYADIGVQLVAGRTTADPRFPADTDGFFLGFDASHAHDFAPEMAAEGMMLAQGWQIYRTREYMTGECTRLAAQIARRGGKKGEVK